MSLEFCIINYLRTVVGTNLTAVQIILHSADKILIRLIADDIKIRTIRFYCMYHRRTFSKENITTLVLPS